MRVEAVGPEELALRKYRARSDSQNQHMLY